MLAIASSLASWAARSVGPRVARLLLAQLLLLTLVGGINWRSVSALLIALHTDADARAVVLGLATLATVSARGQLRHALCPPSLAVLRRQPLGTASFALLVLPFAAALAWAWALVLGIAHPDAPLVVASGWLLGALAVAGVASAGSIPATIAWALLPLAAAVLLDRSAFLAVPALGASGTLGVLALGRGVRGALVPRRNGSRGARLRVALADTPLGALLAFDASALATRWQWLSAIPVPLGIALYVVVLDANGNCRGACLDRLALIATTFAAGASVTVLDTLRRVQGARLLVPDRVVSTRLRLVSLCLAALAPVAPIALGLALLSDEAAVLPHAVGIALVVLWCQLGDTTRAAEVGPLVWCLLVPASVALLPGEARFVASALVALAFAALAERRGRALRATLGAARGPSDRY